MKIIDTSIKSRIVEALTEEGFNVAQCGVHKAKTEHTCHICDQTIDVGIRHAYAFLGKFDSEHKKLKAESFHWHIDCFNDEYRISI